MSRIFLCAIPFCLAGAAAWADQEARPNLSGTWQLDASKSEIHSRVAPETTWTINQKEDNIHIEEGKSTLDCTTLGKDCVLKEAGKPAKVSFWYNGPALVEMETLGHNGESITKKRMKLSGDGSTLTVEVVHIVPDGRPETWVLRKK